MGQSDLINPPVDRALTGFHDWRGFLKKHVKKRLIQLSCWVGLIFDTEKCQTQPYRKQVLIRDGRILLIKEAEEIEALDLINYMSCIKNESRYLTFDDTVHEISIAHEQKFIKKCKESYFHALLVGWLKNEVAGYLAFRSLPWQRILRLGEFTLTVSKNSWGLGIGGKLLHALIDWSRKNGVVKHIRLRVRPDNHRAITVYDTFGFVKRRSLVWEPFDQQIMRLTL